MNDKPGRIRKFGGLLLAVGIVVLVISGLNFATAEPPPLDYVDITLKKYGVETPRPDYRSGPKLGLGLGAGLTVLGVLLMRGIFDPAAK